MAKPLIYLVSGTCWCCSTPGYSLNGYGFTPREAYEKWLRTEVKMEIARAKASIPREKEDMIYVDEVFEESHRVVMAEVLRIGKKVLPVILALVAGFLIGVLYGAG